MKIGLSTNGKTIDEEFFRNCRDSGIDCIEISLKYELCPDYDYESVKELADRYSIELWTYHLPFFPFATNDISSTDEEKRRNSVENQKYLINKVAKIGIKHFVIHPSAEHMDISERKSKLNCAKRSLSELADEADKYGAVICVEDLPRDCLGRNSFEIRELIKDDDRLKVCFDTNHLLEEYLPEFIRNVGSRIVTTHVSDYDFLNERHWLPGEGKIDWNELYNTLLETGYEGPWLYEIGFKAPQSIVRNRDLTCADFVRNAKEIAEGKELTVLGKPIENLPFRL